MLALQITIYVFVTLFLLVYSFRLCTIYALGKKKYSLAKDVNSVINLETYVRMKKQRNVVNMEIIVNWTYRTIKRGKECRNDC